MVFVVRAGAELLHTIWASAITIVVTVRAGTLGMAGGGIRIRRVLSAFSRLGIATVEQAGGTTEGGTLGLTARRAGRARRTTVSNLDRGGWNLHRQRRSGPWPRGRVQSPFGCDGIWTVAEHDWVECETREQCGGSVSDVGCGDVLILLWNLGRPDLQYSKGRGLHGASHRGRHGRLPGNSHRLGCRPGHLDLSHQRFDGGGSRGSQGGGGDNDIERSNTSRNVRTQLGL